MNMNKRNDWEQVLTRANEALSKKGYEIRINDDGDGYYNCEIFKNNRSIETYAENYFEEELTDLVIDAWDYVETEKPGK